MPPGLKQQWGLKDPQGAPSTKQADQFKAAFQPQLTAINQALQYTAVNAEKSKHGERAAKRDKLTSDYNSVLGKIDPKNPSVAKSAIDTTLGAARSLAKECADFKNAVERCLKAWQAKEPTFEKATGQVEELEVWGDKQAADSRGQITQIQQHVNNKLWEQAVKACDALVAKLKPIYDEYLKQKAAKEKYDAALAEMQPQLADASQSKYQKLVEKQAQITASQQEITTAANEKNYVQACKVAGDLKGKLNKFTEELKKLDEQKKAYEDALAPVDPKLKQALDSKYTKLATLREELAKIKQAMEAAAQAEDFQQALKICQDLATKVDTFLAESKKLDEQKKAYEDALTALDPKLKQALESKYKKLATQRDEITNAQKAADTTAKAEDFEQALKLVGELATKVDALLAEIKKIDDAKKEYEAAQKAAQPKLDDCLVSARDYPPLKGDRDKIIATQKEMETAVQAEDFEKAKQLAADLGTQADAYMAKAKTEQEKYDKMGADIEKALEGGNYFTRDDIARDWVNNKLSKDDIKYLPQAVRNRLMEEMQDGNFSDDDKKAIDKMYTVRVLDPEFEKEEKRNREKLIAALRNDPDIAKARTDWPTLTQDQRIELMKKVANYQVDIYGTKKVEGAPDMTFDTNNEPPDANGQITMGTYNHSDGKFTINTNSANPSLQDFDRAVDLAAHETGHRYQAKLANDVKTGKIKPGDPLYDQGKAFLLNDNYYPNDPWDVYSNQPMEAHSRISGQGMQDAKVGKT